MKTSESASKPTILIVEDNPELRAYMPLLLEDEYHVITTEMESRVGSSSPSSSKWKQVKQ